jgi:hypothetical protein
MTTNRNTTSIIDITNNGIHYSVKTFESLLSESGINAIIDESGKITNPGNDVKIVCGKHERVFSSIPAKTTTNSYVHYVNTLRKLVNHVESDNTETDKTGTKKTGKRATFTNESVIIRLDDFGNIMEYNGKTGMIVVKPVVMKNYSRFIATFAENVTESVASLIETDETGKPIIVKTGWFLPDDSSYNVPMDDYNDACNAMLMKLVVSSNETLKQKYITNPKKSLALHTPDMMKHVENAKTGKTAFIAQYLLKPESVTPSKTNESKIA